MPEDKDSFSHLVVVGSSAGGIEALSTLFSNLPEDFPAPIVVAQHLDPLRESHLQEILSRRSKLPVKTITDRAPLEAGVIFVVPSNWHVDITDSEIGLQSDSSGRPMPSIDRLMSTAAGVYEENLVAVILSGTGTDGTEGARVVRRSGGTVIIQDPETAEFGGMPGSLAPNTVDIVAGLERIGPVLGELLSGAEVTEGRPQAEERRSLERLLHELRERHGVDFTSYKAPTMMRRLQRRMVAVGTHTIDDYAQYLRDHPDEYRQLVNTFLIKVTEFFRDPELFDYLREDILPRLVEQARDDGSPLRIWSAGCATGEEAYSLAILLSEILGNEAGTFNARIFATDVDHDAITFARHGLYPPSALSNLSEEQIERYFDREGGQYQVRQLVRSMVVFGEHDLAHRSPFPRIDLTVSRNVLIYFTTELQRRALQLFAYSLRDGGYLVLGKAETTSPLSEYFEHEHRSHKVYRRTGERFLIPPTIQVSPAPTPPRVTSGSHVNAERRDPPRLTRAGQDDLLNQLPVGVVQVNRRYDIQSINTVARRLLSIHGAAIGEDLLHLLQNAPYAEARRAIDAAFRDGENAQTDEFAVEDAATGEVSYFRLMCRPMREEEEPGPTQTVAVVIYDVTESARARNELDAQLGDARAEFESVRREAEAAAARAREKNERLVEENRRLEAANRELTDLNQNLQIAHEEAQIGAEEAQASTEEVETLNEELQATNEELETLNEELQATIEELNTTNDDLQARTAELQDLARKGDEEQGQLRAIIESIPDAVLVVEGAGRAVLANAAYRELFSADGLPAALDDSGNPLPPDETPLARTSRGETFVAEFAAAGEDGRRRRFRAEGRPTNTENGGGVLVIRELGS